MIPRVSVNETKEMQPERLKAHDNNWIDDEVRKDHAYRNCTSVTQWRETVCNHGQRQKNKNNSHP